MYTQDNFSQLDEHNLSDLLFQEYILQKFSPSFVDMGVRTSSDSLMDKDSALSKFFQNNPDFQWQDTHIEHFSFNGEYVEFSLINASSNDIENLPAILRFKAKNLTVKNSEYELDDNHKFNNVYSDAEENEHINDILNDYSSINNITLTQANGRKSFNISFINDQFKHDNDQEDNESDSEYANVLLISFEFVSAAIVKEFLNDE